MAKADHKCIKYLDWKKKIIQLTFLSSSSFDFHVVSVILILILHCLRDRDKP